MELKNNINDSKQLISIIQSRYPKMSKGQKLIAQYIIKNYDKDSYKDIDVKVVTATNICIGKCKLITNSEEYDYFDVEIEID